MCASAAVTGLGTALAGAAASAFGAYTQQTAANDAASYNAQVATYQQQQAIQLGNIEASEHDMQVRQLIGQQSADYGGSGVDPNSGSAAIVKSQTAGFGALDSLAIKQQAATQAWGYGNAATLDRMKIVNPALAAGTSLLNSSSGIGTSLLTAQRVGAWGRS